MSGNIEVIAQHRQEIFFGKKTELNHQPAKRRLLLLLKLRHPLQLFAGDELPFDQHAPPDSLCFHLDTSRSTIFAPSESALP